MATAQHVLSSYGAYFGLAAIIILTVIVVWHQITRERRIMQDALAKEKFKRAVETAVSKEREKIRAETKRLAQLEKKLDEDSQIVNNTRIDLTRQENSIAQRKASIQNELNRREAELEQKYRARHQELEAQHCKHNKQLLADKAEITARRLELEKDIHLAQTVRSYVAEQHALIDEILRDPLNSASHVQQMITDCTYAYDQLIAFYLESKKPPAIKASEKIREYAKAKRDLTSEVLLYKYRLSIIETVFPWISEYYDRPLVDLSQDISPPSQISDDEDPAKDYLTSDEWHQLTTDQRSQLALDRYLSSHKKTKWEIGRDYELFVGHVFAQDGYHVEYTGSLFRFDDLGRDLIVRKSKRILIVQCKYWSKEKTIHEKHVFQLYGTSICYQIDHPECQVSCVLVTNTVCSDAARAFAQKMGVALKENYDLGEFPRIKCNISSSGEKIYHLPMDQQYDNVIIDKHGEFFAKTVQEAVNRGFRRAYRWHGDN